MSFKTDPHAGRTTKWCSHPCILIGFTPLFEKICSPPVTHNSVSESLVLRMSLLDPKVLTVTKVDCKSY